VAWSHSDCFAGNLGPLTIFRAPCRCEQVLPPPRSPRYNSSGNFAGRAAADLPVRALFQASSSVLQNRQRTNPFYAALIVVGIAFTITAAAYFVMTLRGNKSWPGPRQAQSAKTEEPHGLLVFLEQHGVTLMAGDLGLLALAAWGAIGTDHWWSGSKSSPPRRDDGTQ
jgi:hypothetical protein